MARYAGDVQIERNAYHEAGHIFIHLLTGIELTIARIIENDKQYDLVVHDNYDLTQYINKELRDNQIMCVRAGSVAEKYYCWLKGINYDPQMSGNDIWETSRLYYEGKHKFKVRESFEKHLKGLDEETERLIKTHWSFVEIVVQNLLKNKKLTAGEIYELWKNHFIKK